MAGMPPLSIPPRSILLALTWYDHRIHAGVARFALEHGWNLDARMANSKEALTDWSGDGVVCKLGCSTPDPGLHAFVRDLRLPLVDMSFFHQGLRKTTMVEFDNHAVARLATEHFLGRGIRNFAYFPATASLSVADRRECFCAELKRRGHALHPLAPCPGHWSEAEGDLGRQLASLPGPVGVLCFNDNYGVKVLHAAARAGLRVPEQVAILGIDNNALVCEHLATPLSSVVLDMEAQGYRAAEELQRLMNDRRAAPRTVFLPPAGICVRRSTDHVATDHTGVSAAVRFIHDQFRQPIQVEDVAGAARMARSSLKQAFQDELGRSVTDEIERIRMQEACRLLAETGLKLSVVAQRAGLNNERRLLRCFRTRLGMTPHTYRTSRGGM